MKDTVSCLDQTTLMPTAAWGRTALCASLPMLKDTSYYITKGSSHSCVMGSCFLRCELMGTQVCNQKVVAITFLLTAGEKKKKHLCLPFDPFDEVFILHITALGMPVKVSCS